MLGAITVTGETDKQKSHTPPSVRAKHVALLADGVLSLVKNIKCLLFLHKCYAKTGIEGVLP